jgi:hypothetical protein
MINNQNTQVTSNITNEVSNITKPVKNLLRDYRKEIAFGLVILCIVIVLITLSGFIENNKHDGYPMFLMSVVSYMTTTTALVTALLFLI